MKKLKIPKQKYLFIITATSVLIFFGGVFIWARYTNNSPQEVPSTAEVEGAIEKNVTNSDVGQPANGTVEATKKPETTGASGAVAASGGASSASGSSGTSASGGTPSTSVPSGAVCGTAGYNGNVASLPTFQSKYSSSWRSDYSYAEPWNVPGQTFENFRLSTNIFAKSDNLIIRNFYLGPGDGYYPFRTDDRDPGAGTQIYNGTIAVSGATDDSLYKGIVAAVDNLTISDMDISGTHDGIAASGNNIAISNVCIHDLGTAPTAHNDGIEIYGGSNISIKNSSISNKKDQTSAINITNDYGPINNILIENVTLSGGGYTIYVRGDGANGGAITNIRFRNVTIANPGHWGVISYVGAPGAIVEWDVKDANGNPIAL